MMGCAFLMKQPGLLFAFFGLALLLWLDWQKRPANWRPTIRRAAIYLTGVTMPYLGICLLLWWFGFFDRFWYWTVTSVRHYGSALTFGEGFRTLACYFAHLSRGYLSLWALAGIGMVLLLFHRRPGCGKLFILGLLAVSIMATSAGFYFREHYFVLMVPVLSLLIATGVDFGRRFLRGSGWRGCEVGPFLVFGLIGIWVAWDAQFFIFLSPGRRAGACIMGIPFHSQRSLAVYSGANQRGRPGGRNRF